MKSMLNILCEVRSRAAGPRILAQRCILSLLALKLQRKQAHSPPDQRKNKAFHKYADSLIIEPNQSSDYEAAISIEWKDY